MHLNKLKEPFQASDIEWRVQQSGKTGDKIWALVLAYVTNRAIMDRLDVVCGAENWYNTYSHAPEGGVLCGITIKTTCGWITKYDGAANTEVKDSKGELQTDMNTKGGLSNSMKRAAVQWGIGRYLYKLEANFADVCPGGKHRDKLKDGTKFKWNPPKLPAWALPPTKEPTGGSLQGAVQAIVQDPEDRCVTKEEADELKKAVVGQNISSKVFLPWLDKYTKSLKNGYEVKRLGQLKFVNYPEILEKVKTDPNSIKEVGDV